MCSMWDLDRGRTVGEGMRVRTPDNRERGFGVRWRAGDTRGNRWERIVAGGYCEWNTAATLIEARVANWIFVGLLSTGRTHSVHPLHGVHRVWGCGCRRPSTGMATMMIVHGRGVLSGLPGER
jgi:hypothetical protein